MITDNIIKEINDIEDENIVIGVSAGPDSMALLHQLNNLTKKRIICAHINHNIRPQSEEEQQYLKKYCNSNNIIFESTKINSYSEKNFENEARKKRYAFYEKILKKYNSHYLFLAHHGDDLIETIMMKIIRGSNLEGYAGIKMYSKQKNYIILRPLLNKTKDDIIKYNQENNIKYYIDNTNNNENYTRNRYRKNILPILKKEDKKVHLKFLKYSNTLQEYYNYVEDITKDKINLTYNNNTINIDLFNQEHPFMKKSIIFYILSNIYNNETNIIKDKHITSIINLANSNKANSFINLPNDYIVKKTYQKLTIQKDIKSSSNNYKIKLAKNNKIGSIIIKRVNNSETDGNNVCRLNSKNIALPLYLRNKKNGDCISILGLECQKKVKDIFIEAKIPIEKRKSYPVLVDSNDNILWIPNIKKSKYNVKKNEIYDIILTSYEESEEKNEKQKENK